MSSEERSRKALTDQENQKLIGSIRPGRKDNFKTWLTDNMSRFEGASEEVFQEAEKKYVNHYGLEESYPEGWDDMKATSAEPVEAPAIISELSKSDPPKPKESRDVEFVGYNDYVIGQQVSRLDEMLVEDTELPGDWGGPFIERCMGRNQNSGKMLVARIPARAVKVEPEQVMSYRGNVVADHLSTHSNTVKLARRRTVYVFDRTYKDPRSGKEYTRCSLVLDRVHQAGLMYEKAVDKRAKKAYARIRRQRGFMNQVLDEPMYEVIGAKQTDYRDLKRLFERHFLQTPQEALADDIGLKILTGQ